VGTFITLTTDFGSADGYVAAMKGVIFSINPEAAIVDITHHIQPQNIRQAAFVLSTAHSYFPSYTVHLVVVDPEVGTNRRSIILKTPKAHYVAPDNGVLSYIIDAFSPQSLPDSRRVKLGAGLKAYAVTRSEYWHQPVSNTFHGRDIYAPVAARLSLGLMASSLGDEIDTLTAFPISRPYRQGEETVGSILHIDHFGNLITNIRQVALPTPDQSATIEIGASLVRGLVRTYAEGSGPVALFGSSGYLEISVVNGNAAAFFKSRVGDEIRVKPGGT
jgi:S-adenosyl-L-methionine hydrolase (adenosine-forming)